MSIYEKVIQTRKCYRGNEIKGEERKVENRARKLLKKEKNCIVLSKVRFGKSMLDKRMRELDLVGISKKGKVYVVERKPGSIRRPYQGIGQLIFSRMLIHENFKDFVKSLIHKIERDRELSGETKHELRDRINSSEQKFRWYLILSSKYEHGPLERVWRSIEKKVGINIKWL